MINIHERVSLTLGCRSWLSSGDTPPTINGRLILAASVATTLESNCCWSCRCCQVIGCQLTFANKSFWLNVEEEEDEKELMWLIKSNTNSTLAALENWMELVKLLFLWNRHQGGGHDAAAAAALNSYVEIDAFVCQNEFSDCNCFLRRY